MSKEKWYVGFLKSHPGALTPFKASRTPTEKDYPYFKATMGPFETKRGAVWMATYGYGNPVATTVKAVERIARLKTR